MSKKLYSIDQTWDHVSKLTLEASKLSLLEELEPKIRFQNYKGESRETNDPGAEGSLVYSSSLSLSRNSTISSTSTGNSHITCSSPTTYNHTSNDTYFLRAKGHNGGHKPHPYPNSAFASPPSTPKSPHYFYPDVRSAPIDTIVEPNGCFVPCKRTHSISFTETRHYHFVVPVFAAADQRFATMLLLLFNHKESDVLVPKEDYEKTIVWQIDNTQSLLTLSEFTHQDSHGDTCTRKLIIENLGRRLGISTIIISVSSDSVNDIYIFLDQLVQSMDQQQTKNTCLWWNKVILVLDQQNIKNDTQMYDERKLFLVKEMPKIRDRYQLSEPLSVLFISTELFNKMDLRQEFDYKVRAQRILWQMMERLTFCGRWIYSDQTDMAYDPADDTSSSCSDDMYTLATVIEYKNGKRKTSRKLPQYERLNSYPGDDGSKLPE